MRWTYDQLNQLSKVHWTCQSRDFFCSRLCKKTPWQQHGFLFSDVQSPLGCKFTRVIPKKCSAPRFFVGWSSWVPKLTNWRSVSSGRSELGCFTTSSTRWTSKGWVVPADTLDRWNLELMVVNQCSSFRWSWKLKAWLVGKKMWWA